VDIVYLEKKHSASKIFEMSDTQYWPGLEVRSDLGVRNRSVFVKNKHKLARGYDVCDYKGEIISEQQHNEKLESCDETEPQNKHQRL
jgi:hypothetical protein